MLLPKRTFIHAISAFMISIIAGFGMSIAFAAVMDGWDSSVTLSAGSYSFTVPDEFKGGTFTHRASNSAGAASSCTVQYDPLPPIMDAWHYSNAGCNTLTIQMDFDEQGLSGLRQVHVTITNPDESKNSYQPVPTNDQVSFDHLFDQTGEYLIDYLTKDNADNVGGGVLKMQIQAAASCDDDVVIESDVVIEDQSNVLCGNAVIDTGEQCDDGNKDNGDSCSATCQFEFNGIQVIGLSHSDLGLTSRTSDVIEDSTGDLADAEMQTAIHQNIVPFLNDSSNFARACTSPAIVTSKNWDTFPCLFADNSIMFFANTSVLLEDPSGTLTLPTGAKTILVYNGNIHMQSNIVYPDATSTFGMLAISQDDNDSNPLNGGGHVYIGPSVTNIASYLYADGTVAGLDTAGVLITEHTTDTIMNLRNQLYWNGSISSLNTIGGSDRRPAECPAEIEIPCQIITGGDGEKYRALTRIFDLNYLRAFHENVIGTRAGRNPDGSENPILPDPPDTTNNNHTFIIEYDSRIKSNPPPLFSGIAELMTGEVGY